MPRLIVDPARRFNPNPENLRVIRVNGPDDNYAEEFATMSAWTTKQASGTYVGFNRVEATRTSIAKSVSFDNKKK